MGRAFLAAAAAATTPRVSRCCAGNPPPGSFYVQLVTPQAFMGTSLPACKKLHMHMHAVRWRLTVVYSGGSKRTCAVVQWQAYIERWRHLSGIVQQLGIPEGHEVGINMVRRRGYAYWKLG